MLSSSCCWNTWREKKERRTNGMVLCRTALCEMTHFGIWQFLVDFHKAAQWWHLPAFSWYDRLAQNISPGKVTALGWRENVQYFYKIDMLTFEGQAYNNTSFFIHPHVAFSAQVLGYVFAVVTGVLLQKGYILSVVAGWGVSHCIWVIEPVRKLEMEQ